MKTVKLSITVIIIFLLTSCGSENGASESEAETPTAEKTIKLTEEQFSSSGMTLGKLSEQTFSERIHATGMLDVPPQFRADVSVFFGGTVKNLELLVGQTVKKGDILFSLENPDYIQMQQDYLTAKNRLNYLKAEYERQKNLLDEKVSSRKTFLKAQSDYLTVLSNLNALKKKLGLININADQLTPENISTYANIKAPIGGYIISVNITKGQYLTPNEVAVTIVNTEHMHLELNVFEKDITRITEGQRIRFRLPDTKKGYYEGEVFLVGRAVSADDRHINVHGHLIDETQTKDFIPGMYLEAEILVNAQKSPALPSDAVVNVGKAYYVLVKSSFDGKEYIFAQKEVKIGRSNDGYTEILNPEIFEGKEIMVKGAFDLIQ